MTFIRDLPLFLFIAIWPVISIGQTFESSVEEGWYASGVESYLSDIPTDDSGKWFVTIFTMEGCSACESLKTSFDVDPDLVALKRWAHFNVYKRGTNPYKMQMERYKAAFPNGFNRFPVIVVQAPAEEAFGGAKVVFHQVGYNNARSLTSKIIAAIRKFMDKFRPGPTPQPQPQPSPFPSPIQPTPVIPVFPPDDVINPPAPPAPVDDPDLPAVDRPDQVLYVVTDARRMKERLHVAMLKVFASKMGDKLGMEVDIRVVNVGDEEVKDLGVDEGETPVLIYVVNDRVVARLNGALLAHHEQLVKEEIEHPEPTYGDMLLTPAMLTTLFGGNAAVGMIVYLILAFLRRREDPLKAVKFLRDNLARRKEKTGERFGLLADALNKVQK